MKLAAQLPPIEQRTSCGASLRCIEAKATKIEKVGCWFSFSLIGLFAADVVDGVKLSINLVYILVADT